VPQSFIMSRHTVRGILLVFGYISTLLGVIGIFIPLLPTTPFLLLASACFIRSSPKMSHWLYHNKYFGKYLKNYKSGNGVPVSVKIFVIFILWTTILLNIFFAIEILWLKLLLLVIAISVSIHILTLKTTSN